MVTTKRKVSPAKPQAKKNPVKKVAKSKSCACKKKCACSSTSKMPKAMDQELNMIDMASQLADETVEGVSKSKKGQVSLVLNGYFDLSKITISPALLKEPVKTLEKMIQEAYVDARDKVEAITIEGMLDLCLCDEEDEDESEDE